MVEEWLLDCAITLDKTHHQILHEYCMVDLPDLLRKKSDNKYLDMVQHSQLILSTNNRFMEDEEYKKYIKALNKLAGLKDIKDTSVTKQEIKNTFNELRQGQIF
ncbi:hypothetical protein Q9251_03065 [Alkalihalobacillus macyae]|uniref:hypothetical protein n=1 Tax=Guptibacillus hwajinpoensis TaxID=208199 RepID=UPI00273CEA0D|nr:hypothetical protein [Alkalihalobacillus macyae]MDP4549856.1 hypothetical protein [Alkalihalobacillus macyae]